MREYNVGKGKRWTNERGKKKFQEDAIVSKSVLFFMWYGVGFYIYLYILRGFRKLVITFFLVKNTSKLINQQLKNGVKIVNWQKNVSYCFFYCQKYPYLKLKNGVKIVNWRKKVSYYFFYCQKYPYLKLKNWVKIVNWQK